MTTSHWTTRALSGAVIAIQLSTVVGCSSKPTEAAPAATGSQWPASTITENTLGVHQWTLAESDGQPDAVELTGIDASGAVVARFTSVYAKDAGTLSVVETVPATAHLALDRSGVTAQEPDAAGTAFLRNAWIYSQADFESASVSSSAPTTTQSVRPLDGVGLVGAPVALVAGSCQGTTLLQNTGNAINSGAVSSTPSSDACTPDETTLTQLFTAAIPTSSPGPAGGGTSGCTFTPNYGALNTVFANFDNQCRLIPSSCQNNTTFPCPTGVEQPGNMSLSVSAGNSNTHLSTTGAVTEGLTVTASVQISVGPRGGAPSCTNAGTMWAANKMNDTLKAAVTAATAQTTCTPPASSVNTPPASSVN